MSNQPSVVGWVTIYTLSCPFLWFFFLVQTFWKWIQWIELLLSQIQLVLFGNQAHSMSGGCTGVTITQNCKLGRIYVLFHSCLYFLRILSRRVYWLCMSCVVEAVWKPQGSGGDAGRCVGAPAFCSARIPPNQSVYHTPYTQATDWESLAVWLYLVTLCCVYGTV